MTTASLNVTLLARGLWLKAIGTFSLIAVFLNTAWRGMTGKSAPFAVSMTVVLRIMSFGPLTGSAVASRTHPWSGD